MKGQNKPLRIALFGASGRLGKEIVALAVQDPRFYFAAALTHAQSLHLGTQLGDIPLSATLPTTTDVDLLIDASLPLGFETRLTLALERNLPLVIATTGLSEKDRQRLERAATQLPILHSPNFSLGIALMRKLAQEIARRFPPAHIDLIETHRSEKRDAPSGTALLLAKTVQESSSTPVAIHSLRSGQVIGEHTLLFNTAEERLTLSHEAHSRTAFARGALEASIFLHRQKPGLYGIECLMH